VSSGRRCSGRCSSLHPTAASGQGHVDGSQGESLKRLNNVPQSKYLMDKVNAKALESKKEK